VKKTYADECLERAEKATEGPWFLVSDLPTYGVAAHPHLNDPVITKNRLYRVPTRTNFGCSEEDAEFIAHAREDVPELARRLKMACEQLRRAERDTWERKYGDLADELEAIPEEK